MHSIQDEQIDLRMFTNRKKLEHDARSQIRKQSIDPYNRLHSIAEDIEFVASVQQKYSSFPLLANLRCGAWYCDSGTNEGVTSHFKSADGHYNGWSFNLRRPNLHILPLIRDSGGICIVDSTRSGKRMPDSLSKTVPIWCAVLNRAVRLKGLADPESWDVQLHTPPQSVSKQEHARIGSRIDIWAESLMKSSYELPNLIKPLRPIWITPASTMFPDFDENMSFTPVVCISASKFVEEGIERRRNGYTYVQGAGDDHENWNEGLTPETFWKHKDVLLTTSENDLPDVLRHIVSEVRSITPVPEDWVGLPSPIAHAEGLLSIATLRYISQSTWNPGIAQEMTLPCVVIRRLPSGPRLALVSDTNRSIFIHDVEIPNDKKAGEREFKASLPSCLRFIRQHLQDRRQVCIACETGTDLSVGVVLVALQAFFDDNGMLNLNQPGREELQVTKDSIRSRLHWIISSRPEANPSRATLKRINEFFMSPRHSAI